MIKIVKGDLVITKQVNTIKSFTDTTDGIYIKFVDNIEIIIPIQLEPSQKAALTVAMNMNSKGFVLDLNNKVNPITITM